MDSTKPTRLELLLLLLNTSGPSCLEDEPIRGRTRLRKEIFLAQKQLPKGLLSVSYPFIPFKYGPFCKEVYDDIQYAKKNGLLEERQDYQPDSGVIVEFRLTDKGQAEAKRMASTSDGKVLVGICADIKKEFNGMGVADLVRFTHEQYPGYVREETDAKE